MGGCMAYRDLFQAARVDFNDDAQKIKRYY